MLNVSNIQSTASFQGLKRAKKEQPVQTKQNELPKKAGRATAVLASMALAASMAGCSANGLKKPTTAQAINEVHTEQLFTKEEKQAVTEEMNEHSDLKYWPEGEPGPDGRCGFTKATTEAPKSTATTTTTEDVKTDQHTGKTNKDITEVHVNDNGHLILKYDNGTEADAGFVCGVRGDDER